MAARCCPTGSAENSSEAVLIDDIHRKWTLRGTKESLHGRRLQETVDARLMGCGINRTNYETTQNVGQSPMDVKQLNMLGSYPT